MHLRAAPGGKSGCHGAAGLFMTGTLRAATAGRARQARGWAPRRARGGSTLAQTEAPRLQWRAEGARRSGNRGLAPSAATRQWAREAPGSGTGGCRQEATARRATTSIARGGIEAWARAAPGSGFGGWSEDAVAFVGRDEATRRSDGWRVREQFFPNACIATPNDGTDTCDVGVKIYIYG